MVENGILQFSKTILQQLFIILQLYCEILRICTIILQLLQLFYHSTNFELDRTMAMDDSDAEPILSQPSISPRKKTPHSRGVISLLLSLQQSSLYIDFSLSEIPSYIALKTSGLPSYQSHRMEKYNQRCRS